MSRTNPLLPDARPAIILNPISDDASTLRMSLVPNVIDTFVHNLRRGSTIYDIFEIGNVYWRDKTDFHEERQLIIGVLGDRAGKKKERSLEKGFIRLKGYAEALMDALGISAWDLIAQNRAPGESLIHSIERDCKQFGIIETTTAEALGGETFDRPILVANFRWQTIRHEYEGTAAPQGFPCASQLPGGRPRSCICARRIGAVSTDGGTRFARRAANF